VFTIECWCYPADQPTTLPSGAGAGDKRWDLFAQEGSNAGQDNFFAYTTNGKFWYYKAFATSISLVSANTFSWATWHHIALVNTGSQYLLFVNGKLEASSTTTQSWYSTGNTFDIGRALAGSYIIWGSYWNGGIQDFRITKNIARYTSNFTPPERLSNTGIQVSTRVFSKITTTIIPETGKRIVYISKDIIINPTDVYYNKIIRHYTAESGSIKDVHKTSVTLTSVTTTNVFKPFGTSAISLYNASSVVLGNDLNFWGGEYTIDGWIYVINGGGSNINSYSIVSEGQYFWGLGVNSSNNFNLYYWTGIQNNIQGGNVPINKWFHLALSYSNVTTRFQTWVNGARVLNNNITPNAASNGFRIGNVPSYANAINGYVKNIRITKCLRFGMTPFFKVPDYKELRLL
jgi:hypothetical protein